MYVVDSSVLIAQFDRSDAHHQEARRRLTEADHVLVTTETLTESLGVIKARGGRAAAHQALKALLAATNVGWEETSNFPGAVRLYEDHNTGSLVDAFVVETCLRLRKEIMTFDKDQEALLGRLRGQRP